MQCAFLAQFYKTIRIFQRWTLHSIRYLLETAVKCRGAAAVVCRQLGENRFSAAGPVAQAGTKMIVAVSKEVFKNIFECSY